jgi:copper chaperone CopZ
MTKTMAIVLAVALSGAALAAEEESIQLKVYVEGMSCPTGCPPKVAKGLEALPGAKNVKLADFDQGLFTLSLDPKTELKPAAFQKSLGEYKVKRIEATLTGTLALKDKELVLTGVSGAKYCIIVGPAKECCGDEKADAKKDTKKEDCDDCPATVALRNKVQALAKDGKNVKVTGTLSECCEVNLTINTIQEFKQPAN